METSLHELQLLRAEGKESSLALRQIRGILPVSRKLEFSKPSVNHSDLEFVGFCYFSHLGGGLKS